MSDETTDESNIKGKEANNSVTDNKENPSELDKLKAANDETEKELIRGRELRAEAQKLEAEKMVGGESNAGQNDLSPKEKETKDAQSMADEISGAFT